MGCDFRDTWRELFKELVTLTLSPQYVFSLLLFFVTNRGYFVPNSEYGNINTRPKKVYTCPRYFWQCIRREFIIQTSKFLMVFLRQLSSSLASLKSLKLH